MKTVLAFMVGVLVGALVVSGGGLMAWYGIRVGQPAEMFLSGLQIVRAELASMGWRLKADAPHPAVRRSVTGKVRMVASSVVLAQFLAPMQVEQCSSQDEPRPATAPESIPPVPPKVAPKPAASKVAFLLPPDKQYARALKRYEAGRFHLARKEFARFMAAHPGHGLVPNALYWTGETWYSQDRLAKAAKAFARIVRDHPRHPKSPDALLKLAYMALRQGQTSQARAYLDQLQTHYPESQASRLGREARSRLHGDNGPALAVAIRG